MKRRFTILSAALALLVSLAIPMGMWGQAPVGTTLWAEDFSGYDNNTVPSGEITNSHSGTTVYGGVTLTYACVNGGSITQTYTSGGPNSNSNLLISKGGGSFTISGISTGEASELTVTYAKSGSGTVTISSSTDGVTISGSTITTGGASTISITFTNSTNSNLRFDDAEITVKTAGGGQQLTPSDLALVDAPVELEFDLYDNASAQTISYTTSSTGAVTVSQSDYITATVNANNTITVTPVAVTNGPQTITVNQAADNTYAAGSVTFTVDIEDSTPSTGSDVTFDATVDKDLNNTTQGEGSIVKNGVTFTCSDGILGNGTEYRLYKNSTTTFSVESGTITQIVFTCTSGNPASGFATQTGWTTNGSNGAWTGNATSVSFVASSKQVRATQIVVTVETSGTPDPTISASNVDIAYSATSGSITYTINNEPSPAGTLTAAVTDGNWLTLGQSTTNPIAFTCTANENTTARTATVTLTYTYNTDQTVTANVTVTQAAAPVSYTTIPALFAAATSTETNVLVTFNSWVVSGVSTDGKNVFVTDNNGNGFIIFDHNGGLGQIYSEGYVLSGTAVSCKLKLYGGAAELVNLNADDLTITSGGTVSTASVAMVNLEGVNTGALVHYENLTCSVTTNSNNNTIYNLSDGTTTLQVYNSIFAFGTLENGASYNITGVYQQFNSIKEILPRSVNDIEYVLPAPLYTVTLCDDQTALTEVSYGAGVTLPSRSGNTTYTFAGWSTTNVGGTETTTAPASIIPAGSYQPTMDIVLYPVYTRTEGSGSTTTEWHLLNSLNDVDEEGGIYVLLTENYYAFNGSIDEQTVGHGGATDDHFTFVDGIATSSPEGTLEITFVPVEENGSVVGYKMLDPIANNYLYANKNSSGNLGWHVLENSYWSVHSTGNWYYPTSNGAAYLRSYQDQSFRTYGSNNGQLLKLAKKVEVASGTTYYTSLLATYELPISSYSTGGYRLIASPIGTVNPENVTNMLTQKDGDNNNTYDLYAFDQDPEDGSGKEWRNYRATSEGFELEFGKGYLYGNLSGVELVFTGTAYNGEGKVTLTKTDNTSADFPGWNLVGNPFATEVVEIKDENENTLSFYTMTADGRHIVSATNTTVQPMEGVFVVAEEDGEEITFTPTEGSKGSLAALNLSDGNEFVDRAIVRFGQGRQLPKLQLDRNSSKLYIPQDGQDYAVVYSEEMGALPVNFKAENNGTYCLNLSSENVEFAYLHLIDNKTGNDVDLLQTPSYSFEAKTTDYESRFKLVFATGDNSNDDTFAFYSNGSFVINNPSTGSGPAELQVIDITGRIVKSESVNGCTNVNVNAAPGVYMLRLVNGDNVKTQKVVVK